MIDILTGDRNIFPKKIYLSTSQIYKLKIKTKCDIMRITFACQKKWVLSGTIL